jgi:hypothetical protein
MIGDGGRGHRQTYRPEGLITQGCCRQEHTPMIRDVPGFAFSVWIPDGSLAFALDLTIDIIVDTLIIA